MQLRKVFRTVFRGFVFSVFLIKSVQSIDYGTRFNVFQLIHADKEWLWYSNFHTQVPSITAQSPWLANFTTGIRSTLTSYFSVGVHLSGGCKQQTNANYILSPGLECWFPLAKLDIQAYLLHEKTSNNNDYCWVQTIHDLRLSVIHIPAVRPFVGMYYLGARQQPGQEVIPGSLKGNIGLEWLISAQCSIEAQYEFVQPSLSIRLKLHSPRVRSRAISSMARYLQEPVESYYLPLKHLHHEPPVNTSPTSLRTISPLSIASIPESISIQNPPPAKPVLRRRYSDSAITPVPEIQMPELQRIVWPIKGSAEKSSKQSAPTPPIFELSGEPISNRGRAIKKPPLRVTTKNMVKPPSKATQLPKPITGKGPERLYTNRNSLFSPGAFKATTTSTKDDPDRLPPHTLAGDLK